MSAGHMHQQPGAPATKGLSGGWVVGRRHAASVADLLHRATHMACVSKSQAVWVCARVSALAAGRQRLQPPADLAAFRCVALLCACVCCCSMWFAAVQVVFILAGRNFMMEYMRDWNPKEVSM